MNKPEKCSKCDGAMMEGYIVDFTRGGPQRTRWIAGAAEKSLLLGLKTDGKEQYYTQTFRCARCGFLENYANAESD